MTPSSRNTVGRGTSRGTISSPHSDSRSDSSDQLSSSSGAETEEQDEERDQITSASSVDKISTGRGKRKITVSIESNEETQDKLNEEKTVVTTRSGRESLPTKVIPLLIEKGESQSLA